MMKMKLRYSLAILAVMLCACERHTLVEGPSFTSGKYLTVALPLDQGTKDGISGIFFPDAPHSGDIIFDGGYFSVMSVPVNADGTLDWENHISDYPHWANTTRDKTYSRVIYCDTGKTTDEWFAKDKGYGCVFFASITGALYGGTYSNINYYKVVIDPETGHDRLEIQKTEPYTWSHYGNKVTGSVFNYTIGGESKYLMKTFMTDQCSSPLGICDWGDFGVVPYSNSDHIIGAHSEVMQYDEIVANKFLNFKEFAPAGAMLRFNMKTSEASLSISRVEISFENTGDNISGSAFMDFSDYENNKYGLISVDRVSDAIGEDLTGIGVITSYYLQDDGVTYSPTYSVEWTYEGESRSASYGPNYSYDDTESYDKKYTDYWYSYDEAEDRTSVESVITVTTTPTEAYQYVGIIPQTTGITDDSVIVFKAYDSSESLICTFKKKLPEGGFKGGVRYDFTLTWDVTSTATSPSAGKYDTVEW